VLVHCSAIKSEGYRVLEEGQPVDFLIVEVIKGLETSDLNQI